MKSSLPVLLALAVLSACGKDAKDSAPRVSNFAATPTHLSKGGAVTFTWTQQNATTLTIEPGAHVVSGTSASFPVWQNTTFTLTAKNAAGTVTATAEVVFDVPAFSSSVDSSVQPGEPSRNGNDLGAVVDAEGVQTDFVLDEVRIEPKDANELQAFLARTGGTVLEDDAVPEPPANSGAPASTAEQRAAREYLVHLDGNAGNPDNLTSDAPKLGVGGSSRFSNDRAQKLFALISHEAVAGTRVQPNFVAYPTSVTFSSTEAPKTGGGNWDAYSDFNVFASTGSRSNVVEAWQWIAGFVPARRVRVAIIDGGFWLNPDGSPMVDPLLGTDIIGTPVQYDFVGRDYVADGVNPAKCSGGGVCNYHGNGSTGVAVGAVNNSGGAAGTGGTVADPILFKIDLTRFEIHSAVKSAPVWGADVANMSFGVECDRWCRQYDRDDDVFAEAVAAGTILVAAAGNSGLNSSTRYFHPCIIDNVLCVGAIADQGNTRFSNNVWSSNYGPQVDIWAPTNIPRMVDGDNAFIGTFGGTSASSPFVAGVVAMMKAVNPGLHADDVYNLIRASAWTDSADPLVDHYVNALKAVQLAASNHLTPDVQENNGSEVGAKTLPLGLTSDLTIDYAADNDFYRFDVPSTSTVTFNLTYVPALGTVAPLNGGVEVKQSCGFGVLLGNDVNATGRKLVYRLPKGSYYLPLGAGYAIPYDLTMAQSSLGETTLSPDKYEPNDTFATRTDLGDGQSISANLSSASDVDYYQVYSRGSQSDAFFTSVMQAKVSKSDMPVTLTLFNSAGAYVTQVSSSSDCLTKAALTIPAGFYTIAVSGNQAGQYALAMGPTITVNQFLGVNQIFWQEFNPGDPINYLVVNPREVIEAFNNSDYPVAGFTLNGPDVHVTVFTEAGVKVTEGVPRVQNTPNDIAGEDITLPAGTQGQSFLLALDRVIQPGSTSAATLPEAVQLTLHPGAL